MASLAPPASAAPLCDYCHQKPKHGTHPYCSKTCAAQIATLCNYCQKKPKYQNFDFCGKNCAALAGATPASGNRSGPAKNSQIKTAGRGTANAAPPQAAANPLLDPVHLAKLVAQHIPQVQSFLAAVAPAQLPPPAPAPAPVSAPLSTPMPPASSQPKPAPKNNPFLNQSKQQPPASTAFVPASGPTAPNVVPQATLQQQPLDCLVPGCGQPVHVDASGVMSDYCSKKHREEAVALGIVPPCIMCLTLPQSDTDYFCGRDCREEAMSKALDP
ncbi:hypothetical protein C8R46DRAFT_1166129 [Mycena filopes]|nr:hypothetical protein C8R46DRAFT_1166129 [Mycena filopes]